MKCLNCTNESKINKNGEPSKFCSMSCRSRYYSQQTVEKRKTTNLLKYGVDNVFKSSVVKEKIKQTSLEKYGVENPFQSKLVQERQQQTNLKRYGVKHAIQNDDVKIKQKESWGKYSNNHPWSDNDIRDKRQNTLIERYGVKHPILNEEIHAKIKNTCIERFGCDNPTKSELVKSKIIAKGPESRRKAINTNLERYGVEDYNQKLIKDKLEFLDDIKWTQENITNLGMVGVATLLEVSVDTVRKYVKKYSITLNHKSNFELTVKNYISSLGIDNIQSNIRIVNNKEIDIFIPEKNIAFECNGTYWHSELNGRDRLYHVKKTTDLFDNGIRLVHIWEHDWNAQNDIVKSMIASMLGETVKIFARRCSIRELSKEESKEFFIENHLQGTSSQVVSFGLFHKNTLVAAMSFGKSRFNKTIEWELMRFANKLNVTVVGGASKLLHAFVALKNPRSIISYSKKDWASGNMYKKLGFDFTHAAPPAYHYTRNYKLLENRIKYQKHKLKDMPIYESELSEWDIMQANGFDRIWDCGNDVWVWASEKRW